MTRRCSPARKVESERGGLLGMASMAELELESGNRLLDDASYFAVVLALLDIESLIVELLALCERDFDLKVSVVAKVGLCRDEGEACILLLFLELADVLLVQQQAARADGVVVEGRAGEGALGDVDVVQEELGLVDAGVAVAQVELARAHRLDLRAQQLDAALVRLQQLVAEARLPVEHRRRLRTPRPLGWQRADNRALRDGRAEGGA
ncbi:unnamed protein product [Chondrus crispus]|uniref:Uncharacterized protein n=1 Tax=Chondrus crispus TaxID=2769 RepID=R7QNA1_CHOCR|nr:unnamed protein product [Chondrus crispus]CDF39564.1 unnamed protein product [Chondrus crispus]|eukprot:XP_005709858.1 unnamed protein product [Chondrus crispus]